LIGWDEMRKLIVFGSCHKKQPGIRISSSYPVEDGQIFRNVIIAVPESCFDGIIVSGFPKEMYDGFWLDGCCIEDNNFTRVPKKPGVYRCAVKIIFKWPDEFELRVINYCSFQLDPLPGWVEADNYSPF
jgi:hypothetical protein